jgi:septum site-determining protein MinC
MSLWAVISETEETKKQAEALGLETTLASALATDKTGDGNREGASDIQNAVLVRRTLRSGQSLRHGGHLVIIGDVNPGAEIVAAGDVVVWGRLRGIVHAGAGGDETAVVCALALAPMQLRISRHIARLPDVELNRGYEDRGVPEVASVQDGQIVVELWGTK